MSRIMLHSIGFAFPIRIDQLGYYQAVIVHAVCLCDGKRITLNSLDGSPDVDDLNAVLQQLVGILGEVVRDTRLCSSIRLVNVYTLNRATKTLRCVDFVLTRGLATDGVVENKYARCAGPSYVDYC